MLNRSKQDYVTLPSRDNFTLSESIWSSFTEHCHSYEQLNKRHFLIAFFPPPSLSLLAGWYLEETGWKLFTVIKSHLRKLGIMVWSSSEVKALWACFHTSQMERNGICIEFSVAAEPLCQSHKRNCFLNFLSRTSGSCKEIQSFSKLNLWQFCSALRSPHFRHSCSLMLAAFVSPPGHSADGGEAGWVHPGFLSWKRSSAGWWSPQLYPPPDRWAFQRLPGQSPRGPHHFCLLLWAAGEPGEAFQWCELENISSLTWVKPNEDIWLPSDSSNNWVTNIDCIKNRQSFGD